jgi:hypothetical protein
MMLRHSHSLTTMVSANNHENLANKLDCADAGGRFPHQRRMTAL